MFSFQVCKLNSGAIPNEKDQGSLSAKGFFGLGDIYIMAIENPVVCYDASIPVKRLVWRIQISNY